MKKRFSEEVGMRRCKDGSTHSRFLHRRCPAFTLVELLVVIAVVAILAALTFVGVSKAMETARSVEDASNLRSIGTALMLYASDNKGTLKARDYSGYIHGPDGTFCRSWASHVNPYLTNGIRYDGELETTSAALRSPFGEEEVWNGVSYMANIFLGGYNKGDAYTYARGGRNVLTAENAPATLILVPGRCRTKERLDFDLASPSQVDGYLLLDQKGGINALFLDNSVRYLRPEDMEPAEFNKIFNRSIRYEWAPKL